MRLTLELAFTSDWHIGSGSGRPGSADRLVDRDERGLPYVRARTLMGLWRDSAETLAEALDRSPVEGDTPGAWMALVEALFGSQPAIDGRADRRPVPGRLLPTPARIHPESLADALASHGPLREALVLVAPSVRIDPQTGAAAEDKLFFTERVRAGTQLRSELRVLGVPDQQAEAVRIFLACAAEGVRALGAKRRRGSGRCRVRVLGIEDATETFFRSLSAAPRLEPLPLPPDTPLVPGVAVTMEADAWRCWRVRMMALDPLQIQRRTLGNVVESQDRLPGALLLGALGKALSHAGLDVPSALASGDLVFQDGLPLVGEARGLPVPRCLEVDKFETGARLTLRSLLEPSGPALTQGRTLREGYVSPSPSGTVNLMKVHRTLFTHNVVEDQSQRPTEEVGGVFSYQAIAAGQRFEARVLAKGAVASAVSAVLEGISGGELRLGRALHADYGRVAVEVQGGDPPCAGSGIGKDELVLWLASPLLVRDSALRPSTDPRVVAGHLSARFGLKATWDASRSHAGTVRIESWQRSWGLPRPSLVGLAPGSVLWFSLNRPLGAHELDALAREGLGERLAEGFGEVVVNPGWLLSPPGELSQLARPGVAHMTDSIPFDTLRGSPFGALVLHAAARTALSRAVGAMPLPRPFSPSQDEATRAQLGALRGAVTRAPAGQAREAARTWAGDRVRSATKGAAERAPELREWVRRHADLKKPLVWTVLEREPPAWGAIAWFDTVLREDLTDEAFRLLVDHFCQEACHKAVNREVSHGS